MVEPARAALSRLPTWVPAVGVVLVLGELTAATGVLTARSPALRPKGATATVVLRVDGVPGGPSLTYDTPAGSAAVRPTSMPFVKKVQVKAGGSVTIHTFSGTDDPVTCSITADGEVLSRLTSRGFWDRLTCHSTVP